MKRKTMKKNSILYLGITCAVLITGCKVPFNVQKSENKNVPSTYPIASKDSTNSAILKWRVFFTDSNLIALIDTALKNNQELNIILQEINIANSEVLARKGAYLPYLGIGGGTSLEKSALYTRNGAVDDGTNIKSGQKIPDPLSNFALYGNLNWEIDIWKKLRNSKKSAVYKYLASIEGKNFMVTNLVSEIANTYYELIALDNQLEILKNNLKIQEEALAIVKIEKQTAVVTELAVKRFEAELFKNKSHIYSIQQKIIETENKINFLVGRFPQPIKRNSNNFINFIPYTVKSGLPSQLLQQRPDIKQAELGLLAAKLDVKSAKAAFYPSLNISAFTGLQAFQLLYLTTLPQSLFYVLGGDLLVPLINRTAIKSLYYSANAKQIQAIYNYERTVLNAFIETANQISNIDNLQKSYNLKNQQVETLIQSVNISINLFKSARADYMEVLFTQRDALEAKMELVETKKQQFNASINLYRNLGGGWK